MGRAKRVVAREREVLRRTVRKAAFLCPDCGSRDFSVEWNPNPASQRHRIAVYHDRDCPVLRSRPLKASVDHYIRDALVANGYFLADYNDDDIAGLHRPVPR